ncbi:DoxX family protein [Flavobacterium sp.]|uniref:DoxX family protein n=1 Tax=Flavobacterium sp. TaxID=239 RepID=UPI003D6AD95F
MKPLFVLLVTFFVAFLSQKLLFDQYVLPLSARIAMCVMLFFTAIGHFAFTKGMTMMIPDALPFKKELVYFTGVLEIFLGIGLLISPARIYAAWILLLFFIIMLPANIYAAIKHIDYQKGTLDGPGPNYLWFRIPLQLFFIAWVYWSSIKY